MPELPRRPDRDRTLAVIPSGRLAPSPTGAQHFGNARTYLLAWLAMRSRQGRIILRIEDIDSPRIKPEATQQAIDDLRWLGLDWDEGPDVGGAFGPYIQSERLDRYAEVFAQLQRAEQVYPCTCSRSDVLAAASAPHIGQEGPIYPGTCAHRCVADARNLGDRPYCWRFRMPAKTDQFIDDLAGEQSCLLDRDLGDFVIQKADRTPAYQLAVVVDDHDMRMTDVLRGDDLLPSAHRQRVIYQALGWEAPRFAHVPLVIGDDGRRLAKRHGDTRISVLREAGCRADGLIGMLAWSAGIRPDPTPLSASTLLQEFRFSTIRSSPFVLTADLWRQLKSTP